MIKHFNFKYLLCFLILSIFISCKNRNERNDNSKIVSKEELNTENIARIDTNLEIPNFMLNKRTGEKKIGYYNNNEDQFAKLRNDSLIIKVRPFSVYNLVIHTDLKYQFEYSFWRCTECDPLYSTIGSRLIINKNKFVVGDTIKGKFIVKHLGRMPCDSTHELWPFIDSCMFSYKIE